MNFTEEKPKGIKRLIKEGSKITGSALGATIGSMLGGPAGAAIGGASGQLLMMGIEKICNDIDERVLSPRERQRTGSVLIYAYDKILKRLELGICLEPKVSSNYLQ